MPKSKTKPILEEHIPLITAKAIDMGLPHVALALRIDYYLCQRPAAILKLRKQDFYFKGDDLFVKFVQNKTKKLMVLPIPPELVKEIMDKEDYIICDKR